MKGIVLAGGTGSRLWPITKGISKQMLPVYDKPMIYYPLSTLMLAGIREILIITTKHDQDFFKELLGNGNQFGISINYAIQEQPRGIAEALIIAANFLGEDDALMILGDNIFYGVGLGMDLSNAISRNGAHIFTYEVSNPEDYGILSLDANGDPISVEEKPTSRKSNLAITGLYYFDNKASKYASEIEPSPRGELEIISVLLKYLTNNELSYTKLSRGSMWLDTGNPNALNDASNFVRVIEERTGLKIACLEEIAYKNGWIGRVELQMQCEYYSKSSYGRYLSKILVG
jgi:glucose-1-phosphate thymidylyltransferase